MLRKLLPRSMYDVMAAIACFGVLAGGTAYAADTVFSSDIVDGEVKSIDVGQNEIKSADVKDQSLTTFDVSTFLGADVVDGTLTGDDIGDGSLTGSDLASNTLTSININDGSLNDEDVGQATFVHFPATIGQVAAQGCAYLTITGINATADHLLLTPDADDATGGFIYNIQYHQAQTTALLQVCNNNNVVLDDGITHFNLLVFDAQ